MKRIIQTWELHDFCLTHGRVIPHTIGNSEKFTQFHCADRRHDDSETVICSEGIGECSADLVGLLSMKGYVVEFAEDDKYLFCTESELEKLKEESKQAEIEFEQKKKEKELQRPENPARPRGLTITRSDMVIEYKVYEKCTEYPLKMKTAQLSGALTPPFTLGDSSYQSLLCVDDCIFCHCPFYQLRNLNELRHNHRTDYDEWVLDFYKDFK